MCLSLTLPSAKGKKCIGFVLDEERNLYRNSSVDRHGLVELDRNCISLEKVLVETANTLNTTGLDRVEDCLCLAVNLASSLLQLHGTPWLSETWCNKCIYFSRLINIEQPYVMLKFGSSSQSETCYPAFGPNPYLVALGIVLLELWERRSFDDWTKSRSNNSLPENHTLMDRAVAGIEWLRTAVTYPMADNEEYAKVVQRCLYSSLEPVQPSRELTNQGFHEAVYNQIVAPLERLYLTVTTTQLPMKVSADH